VPVMIPRENRCVGITVGSPPLLFRWRSPHGYIVRVAQEDLTGMRVPASCRGGFGGMNVVLFTRICGWDE